MHPAERKKIIMRFCDLLSEHQEELAIIETLDSGKPIRDNALFDIPETIEGIRWHAEFADKFYGANSPSGYNACGMIVREPLDVIGCILPWNYPFFMLGGKLGPTLSEGNCVIVKPASSTSLSALKAAEMADKAGFPKGVIQFVPGRGIVGSAFAQHMGVNAVSFTGSSDVGRSILRASSESNFKKVILELGGKCPMVILDDYDDMEYAAKQAVFSAFWNNGENCTANSRIIVPRAKKDLFTAAFLQELKKWKVGDPLDPESYLGALNNKEHFDSVCRYITKGKEDGARLLYGGNVIEAGGGYFVEPTVFDRVDRSSVIAKEEIFGPVAMIMEADSDEDAIRLANDTIYGLQGSIFTNDLKKAHLFSRELKAGTVSVNCYSEGDACTPFGGFKASGFGGKDKGRESHEQYTDLKTVFIDLGLNSSYI